MGRLNIDDIRKEVEAAGWRLLSDEYKNLDSELVLECSEGHQVYSCWRKIRGNFECPKCEKNTYRVQDTKVIPKKGKIRILALDQASYDCGWAVFDDSTLVKYGIHQLSRGENSTARINRLKTWLISMIANWKPDYVALEGIQYQDDVAGGDKMGITVFQTLAHLQGVLMDTCFELKVPFEICPTNTWRSHCGVKGKRRADRKKSMQLIAKKWYDISISNDEADAVGIGKYLSDKIAKSSFVEEWE